MGNGEKRSQKGADLTISEEKQGQKQTQKQDQKQTQKQAQKQTQKQDQKQTQKQDQKQTQKQTQQDQKQTKYQLIAPIVEEVYMAIKMNRKAKYSWLADNLGVSERTIQRAISDLKDLGYISKEHSKVKGEWQLMK